MVRHTPPTAQPPGLRPSILQQPSSLEILHLPSWLCPCVHHISPTSYLFHLLLSCAPYHRLPTACQPYIFFTTTPSLPVLALTSNPHSPPLPPSLPPSPAHSSLGHCGVVAVLTESGASVREPNSNGRTPMYYASKLGHVDIVKILVGAGASVNPPLTRTITPDETCTSSSPDGVTPLLAAAREGHARVIEVLCAAGAIPDRVCNNEVAPLVRSNVWCCCSQLPPSPSASPGASPANNTCARLYGLGETHPLTPLNSQLTTTARSPPPCSTPQWTVGTWRRSRLC